MFYGPRLARIAIQCITVLALYGEFKSPEVLLKRMTIAYFIYLLLSSTLHPWYILPLLFLSIFTTYLFPLLWSLTVILSYAFYTRGNTASTNEILLWIEYFPVLGLFGYEMMYGGLRNKISLCNQSRFGTGSWPWPPRGWHEAILLTPSQVPLKGPQMRNASSIYCEQVGVYLHAGGNMGEITHW